jgi:hypothetical protein
VLFGPSVLSSWSNSNAGMAFFISPHQKELLYPNPPPDGKLARNLTKPSEASRREMIEIMAIQT